MKTTAICEKYVALIRGLLGLGEKVKITFERYEESFYLGTTKSSKNWITLDEIIPDKGDARWDFALGSYRLMLDGVESASWKLYQLQHCCAIAVSCNAFVKDTLRNRGLGALLNNLRQEICRGLGYSLLLCTDITSNKCQRALLKTNGWKDIYQVHNKRTGNDVVISVVNL